jgi:hypothetical protein
MDTVDPTRVFSLVDTLMIHLTYFLCALVIGKPYFLFTCMRYVYACRRLISSFFFLSSDMSFFHLFDDF